MKTGLVYAGVFYLALCLLCHACTAGEAPLCAEAGQSTMDPRLENAERIRLRTRVREPSEQDIDTVWHIIRPKKVKRAPSRP